MADRANPSPHAADANSDTADDVMFEETTSAADLEKEGRKLRPPKNLAEAMWKALRPRQWVKNVLVLMAPISAGTAVVTDPQVLLQVLYAFITFCLASSSIYLINDAQDVEADRAHPVKRFRPIASGVLPLGVAYAMGIVLMLAAVLLGFFLSGGPLAIVIAARLLLRPETPDGAGYCAGVLRLPVACGGRWGGGGCAALSVVPAGDGVWLYLYGQR